MKLTDEERFVLLFTLQSDITVLNAALSTDEVVERKRTGVGFFSTVKVSMTTEFQKSKKRYWEQSFNHQKLPYGGCFMISVGNENCLEIEAIAYESEWPEPFIENEFSS
ncbi:hypothetical protein DXF93_27580 [Escherichia coli]|nr:hypothetical protein DXF93_27580 [Escherichia coli]